MVKSPEKLYETSKIDVDAMFTVTSLVRVKFTIQPMQSNDVNDLLFVLYKTFFFPFRYDLGSIVVGIQDASHILENA